MHCIGQRKGVKPRESSPFPPDTRPFRQREAGFLLTEPSPPCVCGSGRRSDTTAMAVEGVLDLSEE